MEYHHYRRAMLKNVWTLVIGVAFAASILGCQGQPDSMQSHESLKALTRQELERARLIRQQMLQGRSTGTWEPKVQVVQPMPAAFEPSSVSSLSNPLGSPLGKPLGSPWMHDVEATLAATSRSARTNPSSADYLVPSELNAAARQRMTLQPGDVIQVKFFYTPELDVTQMVRPDGKIALQLVGEVSVEGRTPGEVQQGLLRLYESHLKNPEISVVVQSFHNQRVFVGGAVLTPGIIQIPARTTVLEAIMQAGGFNLQEAEVRNVVVIRHKDGQRYAYKLDLKDAIKGEETEPFFLEPQDIVYVPRTKIVEVNQWVDQHINKLIPDTRILFTRTLGNSTIGVGTYR